MWITDKIEPKTELVKTKPSDLLDADKLNSLPHPLSVKQYDGSIYDLEAVCVETGLCRFIVCGLVDRCSFGAFKSIIDADGFEHCADDFYND